MLNKDGFRHHGTRAAGTGQPGNRRQQMQKKDGQIAHREILARSRHAREMLAKLWNSPCTGADRAGRGWCDRARRARCSSSRRASSGTPRPDGAEGGREAAASNRSRWQDPNTAAARPACHPAQVPRRRWPPASATGSHHRVERGRDRRNASSRRGTWTCTWDEPSTSSLQCGSGLGPPEKIVRIGSLAISRAGFMHQRLPGRRRSRATPVRGEYAFKRANQHHQGIAGTLSSLGTYSGVLERSRSKGKRTRQISVWTSLAQPVPLKTRFRAVVNGTNGDTGLSVLRRASSRR